MDRVQPGFENELYDQFPTGESGGSGPAEGFNTWVRINDPGLFTAEALADPVVRAFVEAPFAVSFAQFKSSSRESEYFLHKPHLAMTGRVEGIVGAVEGISGEESPTPLATLVLHHERTLAYHPTRSLVVSGDGAAGQMIVKQTPG
jgi:hypothetical protein